jgi:hypothetical protein
VGTDTLSCSGEGLEVKKAILDARLEPDLVSMVLSGGESGDLGSNYKILVSSHFSLCNLRHNVHV